MSDANHHESEAVPNLDHCLNLMRAMDMPGHIVAHSIRVTQVAELIASHLVPPMGRHELARVRAGALLHDITKARSFTTGEMHSQTGRDLVASLGYPSIAPIVGQHVTLDCFDKNAPITPEEVVNYADKRILHDKPVDLKRRLAYIQDRYGGNPEAESRIAAMHTITSVLETKLFARLPFRPEDVSNRLSERRFQRWLNQYRQLAVPPESTP